MLGCCVGCRNESERGMDCRKFVLAVAAVLALVTQLVAGSSVTWKGKKVDLAAPPADFPGDAKEAAEALVGWADAHGYKLDLDRSGRALVISTSNGSKWVKHAESVLAMVDELHVDRPEFPRPPPTGPVNPGPGEWPGPAAAKWGTSERRLDTGTFVLVVVKTPEDHGSLLARLAAITPYLASWAKSSTPAPGFALGEPLVGAVVLGLPENKEWNAENEFVHRAAELALQRKFGRQPYWLLQGFAWHAEMEVRRGIYCFPYRSGFVWAVEHTGWRARAAALWRGKSEAPLAEVATLKRGTFDDAGALNAWGAATFLAEKHAAGFAQALDELNRLWESGSRKDLGGGSWERIPDYEVPVAEQERVLRAKTRDDLPKALASWLSPG